MKDSARGESSAGHGFGGTPGSIRNHNQRHILTLLRRKGALPKSVLAHQTGLSAPSVTTIVDALAREGLVRREPPIRGQKGQPATPYSLDSEGAFFFGLKVGRRSSELVLADFLGEQRASRTRFYRYPRPEDVLFFVESAFDEIEAELSEIQRARLRGCGIAMPFELWNWPSLIGLPAAAMAAWREFDLAAEIGRLRPLPCLLRNDATAACNGEMILGAGGTRANFLYVYVGYFIGGGIVIDGRLLTGVTGNAAAIGSMLIRDRGGVARQLLEVASIATLERMIEVGRETPVALTPSESGWPYDSSNLEAWLDESAHALAQCVIAAKSLTDLDGVVIDGWLPEDLRCRLTQRTSSALHQENTAGLTLPTIMEGSLRERARSLGAASLIISDQFVCKRCLASTLC